MMESEPCDKLMNVQLKKHLLQQYQKSLEHYHITIISVCFSTKILNQYLPEGSLNRRFKVCDILRHAEVDIVGLQHNIVDKLMFNAIMIDSKNIYRELCGI